MINTIVQNANLTDLSKRLITVVHDDSEAQLLDRNDDGTYTLTYIYEEQITGSVVFESKTLAIARLLQQMVAEHINEDEEEDEVLAAFTELMKRNITL